MLYLVNSLSILNVTQHKLLFILSNFIIRDADTPDCSSNDINNYTYYGSYDYNCGYSKFGDKP